MRALCLAMIAISLTLSACDAPLATAPKLSPKPTAVEVIKPVEPSDAAPQAPAASRAPSFNAPNKVAKMPAKYMWRWVSSKELGRHQASRDEIFAGNHGTLRLSTSTSDGLTLTLAPGESPKQVGWTTKLADTMVPAGQVIYMQGQVFVVAYSRISTGGQLIKVNLEDGKILWRQPLQALGAVSHSQYLNEVQLYLDQDRVMVHGMESGGCYTEARSLIDGALIDAERVDCELVKPPAQWPAPSKEEPKMTIQLNVDERSEVTLKTIGERFDVKGFDLDYKGTTSWSTRISADHATYGRLAADQDHVYVAKAHRIAAGSDIVAFDRRDGAQAWSTATFGVGPIGHSKYSNVLQTLTVTPRGVELYAVESGCSYLEVLDPVSGRTLINHRYYTY